MAMAVMSPSPISANAESDPGDFINDMTMVSAMLAKIRFSVTGKGQGRK